MNEKELENSRSTITTSTYNIKKIIRLENWFKNEYPERLLRIMRYDYLKIPKKETRYALEMEAYEKEQELLALKGKELLPKIKITDLI